MSHAKLCQRYYKKNKKKIRARHRRYYKANKKKISARALRYRKANKEKISARALRYRKANKEKISAATFKYQSKHRKKYALRTRRFYWKNKEKILSQLRMEKYGVSKKEFAARRKLQKNRCAICRAPFTGTPHIDHNHQTGQVRGLLCRSCNLGLGLFRDSHKVLKTASQYLK